MDQFVFQLQGIPYGTYELNTDLNTIDYEFSWYLNGNLIAGSGASLIVNQPGTYVVKVKIVIQIVKDKQRLLSSQ